MEILDVALLAVGRRYYLNKATLAAEALRLVGSDPQDLGENRRALRAVDRLVTTGLIQHSFGKGVYQTTQDGEVAAKEQARLMSRVHLEVTGRLLN